MKTWLMTTGLLTAAALTLLLPIGSLQLPGGESRESDFVNPAVDLRSALSREYTAVRRQLIATELTDSLVRLLGSSDPAEGIVLSTPEDFGDTPEEERFLSEFEAVQARITRSDEASRIGVFIVNEYPGDSGLGFTYDAAFAGRLPDDSPYCYRLNATREGSGSRALFWPNHHPLGVCRYWARFGAPGREIERWLKSGGSRYGAAQSSPERADHWLPPTLGRPYPLGWYLDGDVRPVAIGTYSTAALAVETCLDRGAEWCKEQFLNPGPWTLSRPLRGGDRLGVVGAEGRHQPRDVRRPADLFLFATLIEQEGEEAFQGFWTSNQPVDQAFEGAFGKDPGVWLHGWTTEALGATHRGAGFGFGTLFMTFGLVGIAFGIATLTEVRRTAA